MTEGRKLTVCIYQVGDFIDVDLKAFCKTMNRICWNFHFVHVDESVDETEFANKSKESSYYIFDAADIIKRIPLMETPGRTLHCGITNVWITDSFENLQREPTREDVYFGYWTNDLVGGEIRGDTGLISLAPWLSRYERESKRDLTQYLAFVIFSFIGDRIGNQSMTHAAFRWCMFDYNLDLDTIVWSIRKSRLCKHCKDHIASIEDGIYLDDFKRVLDYTRKPSWPVIFDHLRNSSVFSILVLGILMTFAIGTIINNVSTVSYVIPLSVFLFVIFIILFLVKERNWPGKGLG